MEKIKKYLPWLVIVGSLVLAWAFYAPGITGGYSIKGSDGNFSSQAEIQKWTRQGYWERWHASHDLGDSVTTPVSIFALAMKLFPIEIALSLGYALSLSLTLLFAYLLFRRWRLDILPALVGAVAFAFSPHFLSLVYGGHMTIVEMTASLSILLYFLTIAFDRESPSWQQWLALLPAGVAWGVMMSQEPQRGLYLSVMAGLYALFLLFRYIRFTLAEWKKSLRDKELYLAKLRLLLILGFLLLTFFHSMQGWLSFARLDKSDAQATQQLSREQKWDFSTAWSYYPTEIIDNLAWGYFGKESGHPDYPYWGRFDYYASSEALGFFVLLLMILGVALHSSIREYSLFKHKIKLPHIDQPLVRLFFWVGLGAWLLSMGKFLPGRPLFWLYYHIPFMDNFRIPVKFMAVTAFAWVAVAAWGVQGLSKLLTPSEKNDKRLRQVWTGSLILLGVALVWFLGALVSRSQTVDGFGMLLRSQDMARRAADGILLSLGRFILWASLGAGILSLMQFRKQISIQGSWALWLLLPLVGADLWTINRFYLQKSYFKPAEHYSGDQLMDSLAAQPGPFRSSLGLMFPAQGQVVNIPALNPLQYQDYRGFQFLYRGLDLLDVSGSSRPDPVFQQYLQALLTGSMNQAGIRSAEDIIDMNLHLLRLSGTRFLVTDGYLYAGQQPLVIYYTLLSNRAFEYRGGGKGKNGQNQFLFEVKGALPRLAYYQSAVILPPDRSLTAVADPGFSLESRLVLNGDSPSTNGSPTPLTALQIEESRPWVLRGRIEAPAAGWVLHNMRFHPDWKVTIDGQPATLLRANHLVQAVAVPQGSHTVEFRYQPNQIWAQIARYLVWLGGLAALLLVILAGFKTDPEA